MKIAAAIAAVSVVLLVPAVAVACGNAMEEHRELRVADVHERALREAGQALTDGDYKKARTKAEFATKSPKPQTALRAQRVLGTAALKLGEFETASAALTLVNDAKPSAHTTAMIAEAELGSGRTDRASELIEKLEKDGNINNPDSFVVLARTRLAKSDTAGALAAVQKALDLSYNHKAAFALKQKLLKERDARQPAATPAPPPEKKAVPKPAARS